LLSIIVRFSKKDASTENKYLELKLGYEKLTGIAENEIRGIKTSEASMLIENKDVVFVDARESLPPKFFVRKKHLSSTARSGGVPC